METPIATSDSYGDLVNTYAVKTKTGINVILLNKDAKVHTSKVSIKGNQVTSLELPAWSMSVLRIPDAENSNMRVQQFGAKEMGIPVDSYYGSRNINE